MSLEEDVKMHTWRVEAGLPVFYGEACALCGRQEGFRVHDCRPRTFRLLRDGYVSIVRSGIWRWRCLACRGCFTDYPPLPCRTNAL